MITSDSAAAQLDLRSDIELVDDFDGGEFDYVLLDDDGVILFPIASAQEALSEALQQVGRRPIPVDLVLDGKLVGRGWVVDPNPDGDSGPHIAYQEADALRVYQLLVGKAESR
jgi:hypothetical protein